jgi:hypothetical protein
MRKFLTVFTLVSFLLLGSIMSGAVDAKDKNTVSPTIGASTLSYPAPTINVTPVQPSLSTQAVQQPVLRDSANNIKVDIAPAVVNNYIKVETPPTVVNNITNVTNVTNITNTTCDHCSHCNDQPVGAGASDPGDQTTTPAPTLAAMVAPVVDSVATDANGNIILFIKNNKQAATYGMYMHLTVSGSAEDKRIDLGSISVIVSDIDDGGIYGHMTTRKISDFPSGTVLTFWVSYYEPVGYSIRETAPSNMVQITIP